jgi:hypothetical protein
MASKLPVGVGVRSNWLYFDGSLRTIENTTPEELAHILDIGSVAIIDALNTLYQQNLQRNPDGEIHYPWLHTVQLCARGEEPAILTELGLEPPYREISKTIHETSDDITPALSPYWAAAASCDFEVRAVSHMEGWDMAHDGTWLQVQPPGRDR